MTMTDTLSMDFSGREGEIKWKRASNGRWYGSVNDPFMDLPRLSEGRGDSGLSLPGVAVAELESLGLYPKDSGTLKSPPDTASENCFRRW